MTEWSMTRSTGTSGLIFCGSPSQCHSIAHGGKVDHGGNAGKVLHEHAGRAVGDLGFGVALVGRATSNARMSSLVTLRPSSKRSMIFEKHLQRGRQCRDAGQSVLFGLHEAVIDIFGIIDLEGGTAIEAVE
jgi:hypothetical protein